MIICAGVKKFRLNIQFILVELMLLCFFFGGFLIDLGLPDKIKYILDIMNIGLLIVSVIKAKKMKRVNCGIVYIYTLIIFLGSLMTFSGLAEWSISIVFWLLDCRNLLRFPLFFMSCNMLLGQADIDKLFKLILIFHPVNTIIIIYQYFTVEVWDFWVRGDYLNGFFGTRSGGNQYVNVLLLAVTIIAFDKWKKKKINWRWFSFYLGTCLLDAVLIELKVYIVELILIFMLFWIIEKTWKRLTYKKVVHGFIFIFIACAILIFMIQLLYKLYPIFANSFNLKNMIGIIARSEGYTGTGDLNRLNAISGVYNGIFKQNILYGLFGIGIGGANTGGAMTEFARAYADTHYAWFSSSYVFVQSGILGLALYIGSFLYCYKKCDRNNRFGCISKVMCLMALVIIIYDEVLKTEGGYLVYFLLASGFSAEQSNLIQKSGEVCVA